MAALLRDTDRGLPGQRRRLVEELLSSGSSEVSTLMRLLLCWLSISGEI